MRSQDGSFETELRQPFTTTTSIARNRCWTTQYCRLQALISVALPQRRQTRSPKKRKVHIETVRKLLQPDKQYDKLRSGEHTLYIRIVDDFRLLANISEPGLLMQGYCVS
jgi:hypothetical protein